eukprot:scaffold128528_cov69-Phaeocystis_antarctica.AAC.1
MGKRAKVRHGQPRHVVSRRTDSRRACPAVRRTRRRASESRRVATPSLRTASKVLRWPRARVCRAATRIPDTLASLTYSLTDSSYSLLHVSLLTPTLTYTLTPTRVPTRGRGEGKATCDPGCGAG